MWSLRGMPTDAICLRFVVVGRCIVLSGLDGGAVPKVIITVAASTDFTASPATVIVAVAIAMTAFPILIGVLFDEPVLPTRRCGVPSS